MKPQITQDPVDTLVKEDGKAEFSCHFKATKFPVTKITWLKDGQPIPLVNMIYLLICT